MTLTAKLSPADLRGLAGCATAGSNYVPPSIEAPGAYAPQPVGIGGTSAEAAWWHQFGDPAIDSLIAEALAANLDARLAVARLAEASAPAGVPRAGRRPGGGVYDSYQRPQTGRATWRERVCNFL